MVAAAQLLGDLKPFFNAGFEATDYATAKAIFANEKGAMMVAGTADYTGYAQVNPKADLSFAAWPGPEAGKKATTTGFELLYTVSKFASLEKQERPRNSSTGSPPRMRSSWFPTRSPSRST